MKYPRLPTGPSADGAAGVRALQTSGGDWQYKQVDGNTKAFQQGEFQKVLVDGDPLYVAAGLTSPTKVSIRDVYRVSQPARPSIWNAFGVSMDNGQFVRWARTAVSDSEPVNYTYVSPSGVYSNIQYRTTSLSLIFSGMKKSAVVGAETEAVQQFESGYSPPFMVEPELAYLGRSEVFSVIPRENGRTDSAGRPLVDPMLLVASRKQAQARMLPMPAGLFGAPAEMMPRYIPFVTENAAFALGIQPLATPPAYFDAGFFGYFQSNPMCRAWLHVFPDHDMSANGLVEIVGAGIVSDVFVATSLTPAGVFVGEADDTLVNDCLGTSGRTLDGAIVLVLPGDVALVFCETSHAIAWDDGGSLNALDGQHARRLNVTRIAYSNGSVSSSHVWQSEYSLPISTSPIVYAGLLAANPQGVNNGEGLPRIQSAVYLGNGVVIAKKSKGHKPIFGSSQWPGVSPSALENATRSIDHDVTMLRSLDAGLTWAEFSPVGLDSPLKNQYLGDLVVHRPATEDEPGSVLMTSWDGQAYHVYESKDQGVSWTKKSRLAKPDTFRRIDSWRPGDGGNHFGELRPVGTRTRPVDVSIPNRYKRD